jgi:hypothetical protein
MPTIDNIGPYRFFFYSSDGREPPHVHVQRDSCTAKFWLTPVRLADKPSKFSKVELRKIRRMIEQNSDNFHGYWINHFVL